ncbi:MAG: methylmalonyl-CoA mutase family protein, partial [Caulobacterales bacterium]|nr:methylmalonyl-CoA mutase family protein [Caulobacterales bacterium]
VILDAGACGPAAAAQMERLWRAHGVPAHAARGGWTIDPLGALARSGAGGERIGEDMGAAAAWTAWGAAHRPAITVLKADARLVHEAGGTPGQAIAWAAACGLAYLKAASEAGLPPGAAAERISFALAAEADVHQTIAAHRALRRVWRRIAEACGAEGAEARARIHSHGSQRMLTAHDPWTNLIRLSAAGFAAAAGGADAIVLPAFTDALGAPTAFAQRASRNIQLILRHECGLGRVGDPAAGSYHHEALADALARAAWARFQDIERAGGAGAFAAQGRLAAEVGEARARLEADVAEGAAPIIGVTLHPSADDQPADIDAAAVPRGPAPAKTDRAVDLAPERLIAQAEAGASLAEMTPARDGGGPALAPMRVSARAEQDADKESARA